MVRPSNDTPAVLNVAGVIERTAVNGPGRRAAVWLQGCPRRPPCPGCANPALQDTRRVAEQVRPGDLADRLLAGAGEIEGVTFSGGEPFFQAGALAAVATEVRRRGLTVITFTGHRLEELRRRGTPGQAALLAETDLLVDGPYRRDRPSAHPLRGSANQRLRFLTDRIAPAVVERVPAAVEVFLDPGGEICCSGIPSPGLIERLRGDDGAAARGSPFIAGDATTTPIRPQHTRRPG